MIAQNDNYELLAKNRFLENGVLLWIRPSKIKLAQNPRWPYFGIDFQSKS